MKIESPSFTAADLDAFLDDLWDNDRSALVERLERASARLGELAVRMREESETGARDTDEADGWRPREILAHVAVLSKFYGMLTYKVATGAIEDLDLVGNVHLRDVLGDQISRLPVARLVEMAQGDHRRTVDYLRQARGADLRRSVRLSHGGELSAGDIARLALVSHLEQHLLQLEVALERAR